MWRKFTVYGLRFSKTSFWNRMNTGFLDPAVATVPTACGIETLWKYTPNIWHTPFWLQQYLPLAVLKLEHVLVRHIQKLKVATVPTACGIETICSSTVVVVNFNNVATVPTACGIETHYCNQR